MPTIEPDPVQEPERRSLRQTALDWRSRALTAEAEVRRLQARVEALGRRRDYATIRGEMRDADESARRAGGNNYGG
jgi:hypothetical protein